MDPNLVLLSTQYYQKHDPREPTFGVHLGTQISKELKQRLQNLMDFGKRVRLTRSQKKPAFCMVYGSQREPKVSQKLFQSTSGENARYSQVLVPNACNSPTASSTERP